MGKFTVQFLETTAALITSAFGLVAALAWNETIKTAVADMVGTEGDQVMGLLIYALIVTVIAVAATLLIAWCLGKAKAAVEKNESE